MFSSTFVFCSAIETMVPENLEIWLALVLKLTANCDIVKSAAVFNCIRQQFTWLIALCMLHMLLSVIVSPVVSVALSLMSHQNAHSHLKWMTYDYFVVGCDTYSVSI